MLKIGEVFNLEQKQKPIDVVIVSIEDSRDLATIKEIDTGEICSYVIGSYLGSKIETIDCKGDYDFNIMSGQEIANSLKEKISNDFKESGSINSNRVIESSKDMYDFKDVVDEQNYSPSLKQLIENNRPTAN